MSTPITPDSSAVQKHVEIMQGVIKRMADNSAAAKTWCITLVSAILAIVADKAKPEFALLALIPTLLFFALDVYYLGYEKGFRDAYKDFVTQLHAGTLKCEDLYQVKFKGDLSDLCCKALVSFSTSGFYIFIAIFILIVWRFL